MNMRGAMTRAVRACILTTAVMVGAATSLKEEPTLAPTSDAECASDPLPPKEPRASMAVLDLTHLQGGDEGEASALLFENALLVRQKVERRQSEDALVQMPDAL